MAFFTYQLETQLVLVEGDTLMESRSIAQKQGLDLSQVSCCFRSPEPAFAEIELQIPITIIYENGSIERISL